MKKIIYSVAILACSVLFTVSNTQAQSFNVGTSAINLGIGFGTAVGYVGGASSGIGISGSYEYGVAVLGPGKVGLGVIINYQGASYSSTDGVGDNYKETWNTTYFGVRGIYHPDFCNGKNYDVYAGIQLGYVHYGYSETVSGPNSGYFQNSSGGLSSGVWPGIVVGGRYYFTDNIGAFAEIGYDIDYLKIGLAFKFGTK